MLNSPDSNNIYSVSSLNQSVAKLLEQEFAWIWVEGEISNLSLPASGHIYFSLKDQSAQVSCAMFRGRNRTLSFTPENGLQVLLRAKVSLYQPRGNYQLIVDRMEQAGDGALRRQYEELKNRLAAEGLFDGSHKQELPRLVRKIALITSRSGAAIHDVLSTITRRFPSIPVTLLPIPVQGKESAPAICRAIGTVSEYRAGGDDGCDVILLVRGGGSLEDLWSFNEETVARAIFDCPIPIVTGIGHEVDVTIADFAADIRAATPTAAAETVTPDQSTWIQSFDWYQQQLQQLMKRRIEQQSTKVSWLQGRLRQLHPESRIRQYRQRSEELSRRLIRRTDAMLFSTQEKLAAINARLSHQNPVQRLQHEQRAVQLLNNRLQQLVKNIYAGKRTELSNIARTLNAVSPLQTLERGYSITLDKNGSAIRSAKELTKGDEIETRLHQGRVISVVKSSQDES